MAYAYKNVFGLDLETDHDGTEAWIVQWALSDGRDEELGRDLPSIRDLFRTMLESDAANIVYIHNLSYDWEFFKYAVWNLMETINATLHLNRRNGRIITATVKLEGRGSIRFRDSSLKMPGPLYALAQQVGMQKLEGFDFVPGWSYTVDLDDSAAWDYVRMDARIVAVAMQQMHRDGFIKSTSSGDCWMDAKRMIREKHGKNFWSNHFPSLSLELDTVLRKGYRGGINISQHRGENRGIITHEDVNSMYPTVMMYDPPVCDDKEIPLR